MPRIRATHALLLSLVVTACSTGGSPTEPGGPGPVPSGEAEARLFQLVNETRTAGGRPLLVRDPQLDAIARSHSVAMRDRDFFGHVDPSGNNAADRLRLAGVPFRLVGENLAFVDGSSDPASLAHQDLLGSASHRATILNPAFERVGIGVASTGRRYWFTELFVQP